MTSSWFDLTQIVLISVHEPEIYEKILTQPFGKVNFFKKENPVSEPKGPFKTIKVLTKEFPNFIHENQHAGTVLETPKETWNGFYKVFLQACYEILVDGGAEEIEIGVNAHHDLMLMKDSKRKTTIYMCRMSNARIWSQHEFTDIHWKLVKEELKGRIPELITYSKQEGLYNLYLKVNFEYEGEQIEIEYRSENFKLGPFQNKETLCVPFRPESIGAIDTIRINAQGKKIPCFEKL